jgi:predicted amidophosphoribosyltransferase
MAKSNCDNCGAPLAYDGGLHCDYCGTVYERPEPDYEEVVLYSDNGPYYSTTRGLLAPNEARRLVVPEPYGTVGRR